MPTPLPRLPAPLVPLGIFAGGLLVGVLLAVGLDLKGRPAGADAATTLAPPPAGPAPTLRWEDLASPDAGVFAENLRRIGCPDETIFRILRTSPPSAPGSTPASLAGTPSVSPPPGAGAIPAAPAAPTPSEPGQETVIVAPVGDASLPVAFQPFPPKFKMSAEQVAYLDAMQQQFITDIGGVTQDPASPAYRERWEKARARLDARFRAVFGQEAFRRQDILLMREDAASRAQP